MCVLFTGADIDAEDESGQSALTIAAKFGHKTCERHLFLFRWQERAKRTKPSAEPPRMAHQYFDSAFPVWKKGGKCQLYFSNILPPGEFEGTRFDSPKKRVPKLDDEEEELEEIEYIGRGELLSYFIYRFFIFKKNCINILRTIHAIAFSD